MFWGTPYLPSHPLNQYFTPMLQIVVLSSYFLGCSETVFTESQWFSFSSYTWEWGITIYTLYCLCRHSGMHIHKICEQFTVALLALMWTFFRQQSVLAFSLQQKSYGWQLSFENLLAYSWSKTRWNSCLIFVQVGWPNIGPMAARTARPVPMALFSPTM